MPKFLSDGHFVGSSTDLTIDGQINISGQDISGVTSPTLYLGQLTNAYQAGMQSSVHLTMKTTNNAGNFYWYRTTGSVMYYSDALYVNKIVDKDNTSFFIDPGSASSVVHTGFKINAPDEGGAPAMTAILDMHGYEGRGVGIKMKDNVNSASGATDREWFVGTGYGWDGFNIGYASDGSQSSYAAARKLSITTGGDTVVYGKITAYKSSSHTAQGSFSASNAHLDLYNSLEANTDQKGSIITFTDNYYDGTNYIKTTRAGIKGGTDTTGNTADGYLEFYTDSAGANSPNLALRLDKNQNATFEGHVKAPFFTSDGGRGFKQDSVAFVGTYSNGADANGANDLGSSGNQWRDLYLSSNIIADGDITLDSAGDITLDAAGNDIRFFKAGVEYGKFKSDSNNFAIYSSVQNKDIIFRGNDGGTTIDALTLDMSGGGTATFNSFTKAPFYASPTNTSYFVNPYASTATGRAAVLRGQITIGTHPNTLGNYSAGGKTQIATHHSNSRYSANGQYYGITVLANDARKDGTAMATTALVLANTASNNSTKSLLRLNRVDARYNSDAFSTGLGSFNTRFDIRGNGDVIATGSVTATSFKKTGGTSSQFLMADGSVSTGGGTATTINNNADNRVITGSGTADTLEAESGLTFDGDILEITGSGTTTKRMKVSPGTDYGRAHIGRAALGKLGFDDHAGFAHEDHNSQTNYALLQNEAGKTFLNSASGQETNFRINNSTVGKYNSGAIYFPLYYDIDNTSYWVNPAGSHAANLAGRVDITTASDVKMRFKTPSTDSSDWNYLEFYKRDGNRSSYFGINGSGNPVWAVNDGGPYIQLIDSGDYVEVGATNLRASSFVDKDSTSYYGDFGNTSTSLNVAGKITIADNKPVEWPNGSIRAEGNTLKLVATTLIDLQDDTQVQGTLTISGSYSSPGDLLTLYNTNNGQGSGIRFSDQSSSAQKGYIKFYHADNTNSQGGGALFQVSSTEDDLVLSVGTADATHGRITVWGGANNQEPDYGFAQDLDTGMLRTGTNAMRFVTGGSAALDFDSSQNATFTGYVHSGGRVRIQGGTDQGSQLNLFCDSSGDAHISAYTLSINTGANNSRTQSLKIDHNKNATFAGSLYIPDYIYHSGDTNTYFGFSANDTHTFVASGTERLKITGDVHVQGPTDLNINGTSRRLSFTAGTGTVRTTTANNLYLQSNSQTVLELKSNLEAEFFGDIKVPEYIYHSGDTDTYIRFTDNAIGFRVEGSDVLLCQRYPASGGNGSFKGAYAPQGLVAANLGGANLIRKGTDVAVSGVREEVTGPDGSRKVQAHASTGNGNASNCYNWYSSENVRIDPEKDYEFSVWIKSTGDDHLYLGWHEYKADGTKISGNPYFHTSKINTSSVRNINGWVLLKYQLKSHRTTSGQADTEGTDRYASNGNTSNFQPSGSTGVMHSTTTHIHLRLGTCYGNVNGSKSYFYNPKITEAQNEEYKWTTSVARGFASESFRAPIFYDNNDTSYYLNPNGTSLLNIAEFDGDVSFKGGEGAVKVIGSGNQDIQVGSTSGGFARIYLDGANGDFTGSDYVYIGQNDDKTVHFNVGSQAGTTTFTSKGSTNLVMDGAASTFSGGVTINGTVYANQNIEITSGKILKVDEIRDAGGQDLTITAGEASSHLTQSTHDDEFIRLAAESGVKVYSSTDNLTSGLNKVTTLIDSSGHMSIASDLTVGGGDITLSGTGRIQGIDTVSAGTDAANKNYVDNAVSGVASADTTYEFNFSTQLSANTWTDTGIDGSDMDTGTYIMRVEVSDHSLGGGHYDEYYSATISWFGTATNSTMHDEIVVHRAGHAPNNGDIQFRTLRASSTDTHDLMLQVKHNQTYNAAPDQTSGKIFRFKFRKMI